jgi:hypothetical protein
MRQTAKLSWLLVLLLVLAACGSTTRTPTPEGKSTPQIPQPTATSRIPEPTATPQPTQEPSILPTPEPVSPVATPSAPPPSILLEAPQNGAVVSSPVQVRGQVSVAPFESTLRGRVYDATGQVVGEGPIMVASEMGQPGAFSGQIDFQAGPGGPGQIEVAEVSPKDGAVVVRAVAEVVLAPEGGAGATPAPGLANMEVPVAGERVVLPLHILARVGEPGDQVIASLRWEDGTELTQTFTTLQGEDGRGLLIDSLNWPGESQPPEPPSQPATLELRSAAGDLLAQQTVIVLSPGDPDTQEITLYFLLGENLQPVQRRIVKTPGIGTAGLEELLWGPSPPNLAGFSTALPTPQEVLSHSGRGPDWGPRVTLRKLTIEDGVATADFSQEMRAYGGGSLRVSLIRQQIEQTLEQFPTVKEVVIAVEGQTEGVLQP